MYEALVEACERADTTEAIRIMVLQGAGDKAFVSGTGISQFAAFSTGADAIDYERRITVVLDRLETVNVPTLAAIRGFSIGGGLAIAAARDLRIATRSARFGVPIAPALGNCFSINTSSVPAAQPGLARLLDLILRARLPSRDGARRRFRQRGL